VFRETTSASPLVAFTPLGYGICLLLQVVLAADIARRTLSRCCSLSARGGRGKRRRADIVALSSWIPSSVSRRSSSMR
jgi:hypothetical protein